MRFTSDIGSGISLRLPAQEPLQEAQEEWKVPLDVHIMYGLSFLPERMEYTS
jgi:hypothetical protein